ncbi:hypothetical protein MGYG_04894 [Nannizzia gypsea CBS 118893]|uniref:Uncharacterized protein n=1 Tax=Arthroderma gypseum (strain ATCC MYA-4604 / CBS 118893) TaxID=535722 RepID=E4UXE6_ARTGP|nr:hypothetical protein MGYG_04894 [Nannizzia gypsea CBS 118893]EFR01894.1 hypothetical protein MGYG_04894 [Nannizzia gypsea CBS 118893]
MDAFTEKAVRNLPSEGHELRSPGRRVSKIYSLNGKTILCRNLGFKPESHTIIGDRRFMFGGRGWGNDSLKNRRLIRYPRIHHLSVSSHILYRSIVCIWRDQSQMSLAYSVPRYGDRDCIAFVQNAARVGMLAMHNVVCKARLDFF